MMSGGRAIPLSSCFRGRPVHVGLAPAEEARQAIASPAPWVRQRGKHHRRVIERAGRLLVHQVFLRHREQRGVIPRRGLGSPPLKAFFPATGLASTVKGLHPIVKLRQVDRLDRPGATRTPARDRFMLERTHEPLMSRIPQAGHGLALYAAPHKETRCGCRHVAAGRVHKYPAESPCRLTPEGRRGYPPTVSGRSIVRMLLAQSNQKGDGYYG